MMSTGTPSQECLQLIADAAKIQAVVAGGALIIAPRQAQGYSQLRGTILSDKPGTITVTENVFPQIGGGTWSVVYTEVLVAAALTEFVVDITGDFVQITYQDPGAPNPSNIEINANLWPISALESNRAAANPDVVRIALGQNGTFGNANVDNVGGAGPTQIVAATATRKALRIKNWGDRVVYIGFDNTVTIANGYPLQPQEDMPINFTNSAVWGMAEAGIQPVRWFQELE
jgi:hypothetical protein